MTICLKCDSYEPKLNRCKDCGCFLILKAAMKTTKCPQEKWES